MDRWYEFGELVGAEVDRPVEPCLWCGVAFAAVWMVSAAVSAAVPYAIELRDAPISDLDLVRVLPALGRLLLLHGGGFAGLLVVLAASVAILQTGVFPRWLAWLGIAATTVLPFDVIYENILPLWTWVFIASIVMLIYDRRTRQQPRLSASVSPDRPAS